ncbi:MAG TPA: hypothetical protein VM243_17800 [Phycisphaerae bacterium]|nr:hypothetical protein [Phycisphaerae bacterium]
MRTQRFIVIALLSASLLAMELIWTRLFSAEFFYTYAFLILSLAIMGLGLGALSVRLVPSLGRRRALSAVLTLVGCTVLAGPPLVFLVGLNFTKLLDGWGMVGRLVLVILILSSAFYLGGIALAALFRRNHRAMPRLYMADLLGAGAGVLLAVWMMNQFGTPAAAFLAAVPVLAAAVLVSRSWRKVAPLLSLDGRA